MTKEKQPITTNSTVPFPSTAVAAEAAVTAAAAAVAVVARAVPREVVADAVS